LWQTDVGIEAVLDEFSVPLSDVLSWKVGDRVMLGAMPNSEIRLRCGDQAMFIGHMGRKGMHIAVRIADRVRERA
jgi:flagellar motor switch protein FliM